MQEASVDAMSSFTSHQHCRTFTSHCYWGGQQLARLSGRRCWKTLQALANSLLSVFCMFCIHCIDIIFWRSTCCSRHNKCAYACLAAQARVPESQLLSLVAGCHCSWLTRATWLCLALSRFVMLVKGVFVTFVHSQQASPMSILLLGWACCVCCY